MLSLFSFTSGDRGVLYVIEGEYLEDVPVHGVRYGAQRAAFAIEGGGLMDDHGRFVAGLTSEDDYSTKVTSHAWPFAIQVASSAEFIAKKRWSYSAGLWCSRTAGGRSYCRSISACVCAPSITAERRAAWAQTR